jgi:PAS domain S-box-containing protein
MASASTMRQRRTGDRLKRAAGRPLREHGTYLAAVLAVAAAYYVAAKVGLRLAYLHGAVTAFWPPVGVGVAALVLYGPRLWPGIVIADLLVGDYSTPLGTVLGQTVGNTLEVLVCALLLRRFFGPRMALTRVGEVFGLLGCAAVGTLISATFGATSLRLGGVIPRAEFGEVFRTWWLSDLSGAMVVTPALLTWASWRPGRQGRRDAIEALALLAAIVLLAEVPSQRDVPYVVFPALIWAALRFGPVGASTALLLTAGLTVWNTAHNAGPFVRQSITDSLLSTQLFLATAALTALVLAAMTAERARAGEALHANEERLRSIVASMAEGLIVRDRRGVITECNAAAERILGLPRVRLLGRHPSEVLDGAVDEQDVALPGGRLFGDCALRTGTGESPVVARLTRPDGSTAWVSVSSGAVLGVDGRPEGVVSTVSDVTPRVEAEQRLVDSEQATRTLAAEQAALRRVATLVAADAPANAVFEQVTEEVARLLGTPSATIVRYEDEARARVVGRWPATLEGAIPIGGHVRLDGDTVITRVWRRGAPERVDDYSARGGTLAAHLRKLRYGASVAAPVRVSNRTWGALVASARTREDLPAGSERRLLDFAELIAQALANADAYERLAASRTRIVEAGDAERRRLERNLHDGAQQRLVSLALRLRVIERRVDAEPAAARGELALASAELAEALDELRELARGIHPAILTGRGLGAAVGALADRSPVPVQIAAMPDRRLPAAVEAAAYYIVSEAITNVAKYAEASQVTVDVRADDGHVEVDVRDDGVGGADPSAGTGLRGIADRVEALQGRLRVTSARGSGTRVHADIPLQPA